MTADDHPPDHSAEPHTDILVVGAGPTGLALAAQPQAFGARFRLIDRQLDRVHESRALAIQPRTLEVLAGFGVAHTLVNLGNPAVQVRLHAGRRVVSVPLFDIGIADTAYPWSR
jgi:2-polyprenyl-6-methoxyphenol hydroxylase-like FAD-dependent oxidoreductase